MDVRHPSNPVKPPTTISESVATLSPQRPPLWRHQDDGSPVYWSIVLVILARSPQPPLTGAALSRAKTSPSPPALLPYIRDVKLDGGACNPNHSNTTRRDSGAPLIFYHSAPPGADPARV
ncbi:hypothetical protein JYU34_002950 [Plutella xylostella]|uniref:Uncharacterized protein n=1 Tax=Plutella xylostella TaxID=51655 RepID=A0ABQ7R3L0_PLUXY|nr:hypothetical protein JYU34_002950 [Plutella xylostella]